jgi:hypothetical protein
MAAILDDIDFIYCVLQISTSVLVIHVKTVEHVQIRLMATRVHV